MNKVFCGIDLGGTTINIGVVNENGDVLSQHKIPSQVASGVDAVIKRIAEVIQSMQRNAAVDDIRGVGIGVAGLVNADKGVLREATNFPGWIDVPLVAKLQSMLARPVAMDNDANVAALGEYFFGAGRGYPHMMMVTLGTGVGAGLILNGAIYRGAFGAAGEFGHITIQTDGPRCACGRAGCVEAYVGTIALVRSVRQKAVTSASSLALYDPNHLTPKDIYREAIAGDVLAEQIFADAGEKLGYGIGNVVNLLNIQHIVIGGGVAEAGDFIISSAQKKLNEFALNNSDHPVEIVRAALGEDAGIVGAASLAMATR